MKIELKKILQVLGIVALSLFVIQLILGLVISFAIGGFIFKAVDKIEDKIEVIDLSKVKVDITDDKNSIHINSDSYKKNIVCIKGGYELYINDPVFSHYINQIY